MSETTTTQVFRIVIEAKIDEVWRMLTRQGEVLPFFFGSVLHTTGLQPGAPIRMRTPNEKYTAVVGEVLEIEPPHRYSHTMRFTALDDPPCTVTYDLKEIEGGVEFTLTASDIPVNTKTAGYMKMGGDFITKTIKACLEKGKPPFKSRMILCLGKLTTPFTPKRSRSEHWPMNSKV